jgi:hypothetical protein
MVGCGVRRIPLGTLESQKARFGNAGAITDNIKLGAICVAGARGAVAFVGHPSDKSQARKLSYGVVK